MKQYSDVCGEIVDRIKDIGVADIQFSSCEFSIILKDGTSISSFYDLEYGLVSIYVDGLMVYRNNDGY